jgi:hypothetical protein
MNIKSLLIVLNALLVPFGVINSVENAGFKEERYYTIKDFKSVKKFDTHIHINTDETSFIELAKEDNFHFLDIVDDRPFGLPMAEQQKFAFSHLKSFPEQMYVATTFSVKDFENDDWAQKTISDLKISISKGASAVKIWKNIGMDLKDRNGKFVMLDHPGLS